MIDEKINRKYLNKIKLFQKYNKHYYNLNQPLVDDNEFDKLKLEIIDKFSERCVTVNGNLSIDEISQIIWRITKDRTSIEKT